MYVLIPVHAGICAGTGTVGGVLELWSEHHGFDRVSAMASLLLLALLAVPARGFVRQSNFQNVSCSATCSPEIVDGLIQQKNVLQNLDLELLHKAACATVYLRTRPRRRLLGRACRCMTRRSTGD